MDRAESSPGLLTTRKFQSFPVVNSTCGWLSDSYSKIKAANFVTKCTCQVAESTIKNSMYLASPIVSTFKTQVKCLDSLAFNQLERLENAFPIIKSDAGNIVSQSKELINKTVEPVSTSLENFKTTTRDSVKNCFSRYDNKSWPGIVKRNLLFMSSKLDVVHFLRVRFVSLRNEAANKWKKI